MIERTHFGTFEDQAVERYTLRNDGGMTASIMTWGGVLCSLQGTLADGSSRSLVLGFRRFDDYPARSPYFGATVGRFGNRIGHGRYQQDGRTIQLDRNQGGEHHLHGGRAGFGRRLWQAEAADGTDGPALRLKIASADGEQGYPGALEAHCLYSLAHDNLLRIEMTATCDRPTPVNLVHHSYWNLDGSGTIDGQRLQLDADFYLPTGDGQIPTGEILKVAGTAYDFRQLRRLDRDGEPLVDHAFVLNGRGLRRAAVLEASDGACRMELATDQPAVQCYTGFKLDIEGSAGERFPARSGLCLETEGFPDAPNKSHFPNAILQPGTTYRHVMEHRFGFPG